MAKKYSEGFERDYKFYYENRHVFTFCGTLTPKHVAISSEQGKSAKEVFYLIDSTGKNHPTNEPKLLNELLNCKASVNFHIKQWAEGRADGTLPKYEFCGEGETLQWDVKMVKHKYLYWLPNWVKRLFKVEDKREPIAVYKKSMEKVYGFPDWVIKAVEAQKMKLMRESYAKTKQ